MFEMNKILVPVDFSACSKTALDYAANLARRFGATLHLLHVWEPPRYIIPEVLVQVPGEASQTLADFARSEAGKEMETFLTGLQDEEFEVKGRLESGDPTDCILRLAADEDYSLIVMATHGRTGLSHLFLGSVAEKVVRRAACPVLTIRQ